MPEAHPDSKTVVKLKNVLAVDNDPIMQKFFSRILEKAGLHVVTAKDGITAIDILESYTPDLFFIDLVMPNIDGRALCRIIRSKELFKTSPIVIVSAIAAEESIDTAELGANVCIAKVAYADMEIMINKLLSDPQLLWDPMLGNKVLGVDDLSPRNITNELLTVNRHYHFMLDSISSGIIEFDRNGRVIYANPAALSIFSIPIEIMLGNHVAQLFKAGSNDLLSLLTNPSVPIDDPANHHVKISINQYVLDVCVAPSDYSQDTRVIIMEDITIRESTQKKLIEANNKLEILARIDGLTEVFNRRHFDELLHQEWGRLKREKGGLSLILCDVDNFKSYNDTYGHPSGDSVLQKLADIMQRATTRAGEVVARYGGEEFILLLPGASTDSALRTANRLRELVMEEKIPHQASLGEKFITVSQGVVTARPDADLLPADLINQADKALYQAKGAGRNTIKVA